MARWQLDDYDALVGLWRKNPLPKKLAWSLEIRCVKFQGILILCTHKRGFSFEHGQINFFGLSKNMFRNVLDELCPGEPKERVQQLWTGIYKRRCRTFSDFKLEPSTLETLNNNFTLEPGRVMNLQVRVAVKVFFFGKDFTVVFGEKKNIFSPETVNSYQKKLLSGWQELTQLFMAKIFFVCLFFF